MQNNYRWEQCYELDDAVLWAIVDDVSHEEGLVTSHLLVVNHEWAESLGVPFPECPLPKRIIELLNAEDTLEDREIELRSALETIAAMPACDCGRVENCPMCKILAIAHDAIAPF